MTERRNRDERVSLHGLDPEDALRALLAVRPEEPTSGGAAADEVGPDSKRPAQSSD